MSELFAPRYQPSEIESRHYDRWEKAGYFQADGSKEEGSYCIMLPPPNVTGSLHMGHAFDHTIQDLLVRYNRMKQIPTLWQPGTDHAGIATQIVVERKLRAEGKPSRLDMGRDAFVDKVWRWKEASGGTITSQMRRLATSCDWQRERFTMDEGLSAAVTKVFIDLYNENLIYRGKRLVNWDPVLESAVSDLEVENREKNDYLWHLRYPLSDGSGHLVVATTRPETMLGDSGVAVHPDDERYKHLIGKSITLPLIDRQIPIIADDYVDSEFGSGCVKMTPAHDFNDYEIGVRHNLDLINVLDSTAHIVGTDTKYDGLDNLAARKAIVADLEALDLVERIEPYSHSVPHCERSGAVVEPWLTDQWYVKADVLAEPAIEAVRDGRIQFVPANWDKTYYQWMENIQDWCISRQLWWGHRIPAWYDNDGNIYVAATLKEAQQQAGEGVALTQDEDVLDTWFSSALWPFSTLGWPDNTKELAQFYPTDALVTGWDIIFFWVARMIMFGMHFMDGEVPFRHVYIHGLLLDGDGQKMSKSKGNVLDPLDIIDGIGLEDLVAKRTSGVMLDSQAAKIEKQTRKQFPNGIPAYGTDAMRFTLAMGATQGRDIRFDLDRVESNRNFCNKLWNAARFVMMQCQDRAIANDYEIAKLSDTDGWIISELQVLEASIAKNIDEFRFDHMAHTLYHFIWNEYCSWYLELAKIRLADDQISDEEKSITRRVMVGALSTLLRLLHPVMPFISEELWLKLSPLIGIDRPTIMLEAWPLPQEDKHNARATQRINWMKGVVSAIRSVRSERNIEPGKVLPVYLHNTNDDDRALLRDFSSLIEKLAKVSPPQTDTSNVDSSSCATEVIQHLSVMIPLGAIINIEEEKARLNRELKKLESEIAKAKGKLGNPSFIERAPEAVVAQEKTRLADFEQGKAQIEEQLKRL